MRRDPYRGSWRGCCGTMGGVVRLGFRAAVEVGGVCGALVCGGAGDGWRAATPAWPRRRPEVEKKGIGGER